MTTYATEYKKPNLIIPGLFLLVIVAIVAYAMLDTANSHAITKHGTDGMLVRECLDNNGPLGVFSHKTDKSRELWLCEIEPGVYGIQIRKLINSSQHDEITAFVKNKMRKLEDVLRYINNSGYDIGG